uniref:Deoxynucleoside kinase domain-containing protein n=1 Tax=viral metagenome TaxID=1070528 RepID=A0A6C0DR16_9ZZZZ
MSRIFTIEGNIGSGKSTLLENLKDHYKYNPNVIFLQEPVDEWESIKDSEGTTMLQKFYQDQAKYSFPFQMMAYISRLALLKKCCEEHPNATIITERSLYTDKYVFAKMLFDGGFIEDVNYQIYKRWFDTFANEFPIHGIIYVNTNYEICNERIKLRSRTGESNIPIEYLQNCGKYHDDMMKVVVSKKEKMELDGNIDIYTSPSIVTEWIQDIHKYLDLSQ